MLLSGVPLEKVPIERRIGLGMTRTFQHAAVFRRLSCLDNVMIGLGRNTVLEARAGASRPRSTPTTIRAERQAAQCGARGGGSRRAHDDRRVRCRWAISAGSKSHAPSYRGRASFLLDEPVSGVSAEEAQRLRELLLAVNRDLGIAMLVIEHNIRFPGVACASASR